MVFGEGCGWAIAYELRLLRACLFFACKLLLSALFLVFLITNCCCFWMERVSGWFAPAGTIPLLHPSCHRYFDVSSFCLCNHYHHHCHNCCFDVFSLLPWFIIMGSICTVSSMYFHEFSFKSDLCIKDTIAKNEDDMPSRAQSGRGVLIEKLWNVIKYAHLCYCWCFSSVLSITYFFKLLIQ